MEYKFGPETNKNHESRLKSGFYDKYMQGVGLDIGYRGEHGDKSILPAPNCIGIELDYPGYNGSTLPFPDNSVDFVFASHILEHVEDWNHIINDWYRVLKIGGYIIIAVPHRDLYERKFQKPSIWNLGHHRFYTSSSLIQEIENSLEINSYRIVHMRENDDNYNYDLAPPVHPSGSFEIELVLKKIQKPTWTFLPNEFTYEDIGK